MAVVEALLRAGATLVLSTDVWAAGVLGSLDFVGRAGWSPVSSEGGAGAELEFDSRSLLFLLPCYLSGVNKSLDPAQIHMQACRMSLLTK